MGEQSGDDNTSQKSEKLDKKKQKNAKKKSVMNLAIPEEEPHFDEGQGEDQKGGIKRRASEFDLEKALSFYSSNATREDLETAHLIDRLGNHLEPSEKRPRLVSNPFLAIPSPYQVPVSQCPPAGSNMDEETGVFRVPHEPIS